MGESRSPSPCRRAIVFRASSCRSLAMSQRGVSGRNGEQQKTMPAKMSWSHTGMRQDCVPGMLLVP